MATPYSVVLQLFILRRSRFDAWSTLFASFRVHCSATKTIELLYPCLPDSSNSTEAPLPPRLAPDIRIQPRQMIINRTFLALWLRAEIHAFAECLFESGAAECGG
jgi:hypothetical protein